jgi:hypothetical protein
MAIDDETVRYLFLNKELVREATLEKLEDGRFDVLASTPQIQDDDRMIYDDALSPDQQAFRADPDFTIIDT